MSEVGKKEWEATSRLDRRKGRWLACEVRSGVGLLDPLGFQPPFFWFMLFPVCAISSLFISKARWANDERASSGCALLNEAV